MKYKMLIVSSNDKFNTLLKSLFNEDYEITFAQSENLGCRLLNEREFNFLIINSLLPDGNGYNLAIDNAKKTPTIIFVSQMYYDNVYYKFANYGVITISKPTKADVVVQAVRMLETASGSIRKTSEKPLTVKLEESKKVNLAKMLLISKEGMSEDDAHKYIVRRAMDLRVAKVDIAIEIIKKYHKEA